MTKSNYLIFFLLFFSKISFPQVVENLVPNGDFETLKSDSLVHGFLQPKEFGTQMFEWITPSYGSTDVLNPKFWNDTIPLSKNGQNAAGMIINSYLKYKEKELTRYSEYIQCPLKEPLKAGKKYLVKFDICGKSLPLNISQHFGINFDTKKVINFGTGIIKKSPQVKMNIAMTNSWQTVGQVFTPKEAHEFIVVGFFDHETELKKMYYAVDNISIMEVSDAENAISAYLDFMGEEVVLSNVHFNSNSSQLLEASFPELDKAVDWLEQHPEYLIEIQGHTDNQGQPASNLKLSEKRALSVQNYLLENGIPEYQIQQKGFGETVPITNNTTSDGRALNRRVVLKKIKLLSSEDLYIEVLQYIDLNKKDEAFSTIQRMSKVGTLPMHLLVDRDLTSLHSDERWQEIIKKPIYYQFQQSHLVRDIPLAFQLQIILLENQTILQADSIFWKSIRPFEGDFKIQHQDFSLLNKKHREQLEKLLGDKDILPGHFQVGIKGISAISTVVLHSDDLDFQKKWFKKMELSLHRRPEYKSFVAYLTDKIAVRENRPQTYGTQKVNGKTYPVEDPQNLNKRRKKMHLPWMSLSSQ